MAVKADKVKITTDVVLCHSTLCGAIGKRKWTTIKVPNGSPLRSTQLLNSRLHACDRARQLLRIVATCV
jgi:hypothetical protein